MNHALNIPGLLEALGARDELHVARDDYDPLPVIVPRGEGPPLVLFLRL